MARRLTTTVQVGDVIYAAGTGEADIDPALVGSITADVWDGEESGDQKDSGTKAKAAPRRSKAAEPTPEG